MIFLWIKRSEKWDNWDSWDKWDSNVFQTFYQEKSHLRRISPPRKSSSQRNKLPSVEEVHLTRTRNRNVSRLINSKRRWQTHLALSELPSCQPIFSRRLSRTNKVACERATLSELTRLSWVVLLSIAYFQAVSHTMWCNKLQVLTKVGRGSLI